MNLYAHQESGIRFLAKRQSALLADEMGLGKSRQALGAAVELYSAKKIDRVLILAPAACRFSWGEELGKLSIEGMKFWLCTYDVGNQQIMLAIKSGEATSTPRLAISVVSYGLLPQERHVKALSKWMAGGEGLLVCDESSFLKNRSAKQSKGALELSLSSNYCWLLTGTPIANSPIDLYMQGRVMCPANGGGPLAGIKSFYHFRAKYFTMGGFKMKQAFVNEEKLPDLTKRFSPYVLRREKKDCLDLPPKSYVVREVALSAETWKIYQELKREALLCLPNTDAKPEPSAAVRILRLCQITSGHVGVIAEAKNIDENCVRDTYVEGLFRDVSSEKLDYIAESILSGELAGERVLIVWCRWRRERERLATLLRDRNEIMVFEIFGGQRESERTHALESFTLSGQFHVSTSRRVLLAQPHAGGFGLNLTQASTAVYLSNDFSHTTRVQSEDRCHRIGQASPVTYVDICATGPQAQRTVDHHILACLKAKKSLADMTCAAWREVLK